MLPIPATTESLSASGVNLNKEQAWTNQSVSDTSKQRFSHLLNGAEFLNVVADHSSGTKAASWANALRPDMLIQEINAINNLPLHQRTSASLSAMVNMQFLHQTTEAAHQSVKTIGDDINTLVRA
jgi:hypothetical protein